MHHQSRHLPSRRLISNTAAAVLLGLGATFSTAHAAPEAAGTGKQAPLMLAGTVGMERRQDNREDRRDDRGDRRDNRQDCRDEGGLAGKDKRDCKQEGRHEAREEASND